MHLRRALLLFAIVLGVAAIAASLAPPPDTERTPTRQEPPPRTTTEEETTVEAGTPTTGAGTERVLFESAARRPGERTVQPGTHAIVTVTAAEPGQVRIDSLGRVEFATPQAPAVFDLFLQDPGRHEIAFAPVGGEPKPAGTLVVADEAG